MLEKKIKQSQTPEKAMAARSLYCAFLSILVSLLSQVIATPPFNLSTTPFAEVLRPLWGHTNPSSDGKTVTLSLDSSSGGGFISQTSYQTGLFSANIKLPSNFNTAGLVVAFYLSNGDQYRSNHDELDFEFLGNIPGKKWRLQTNVYGNGSDIAHRGREERYDLWFDPSAKSHKYSILVTKKNIVFYIDEIPIREVTVNSGIGRDYPSKPMWLYGSLWDGSAWATNGGKHKVDFALAPFVSEFSEIVVSDCQTGSCVSEKESLAVITKEKRAAMKSFRRKYMTYAYCDDRKRYPTPLPEC